MSNKRLDGAEDAHKAPPQQQAPSAPAGHGGGIFGCLPARTVLGRVGRGALAAIPVVGAGFAADLARKDYKRALHELRQAHVRLALAEMSHRREAVRLAGDGGDGAQRGGEDGDAAALPSQPVVDVSAARVFGVAAAVDSGVALAHAVSLYGLYQGWEPQPIINAGMAVVAGGLLSAGSGTRGEYLVARLAIADGGARGSETPGDGRGARAETDVRKE